MNIFYAEIKNTIPFILKKRIREYLDVNLTKHGQDLYYENYTVLMKEIKELNKWRDIPCSRIGRLNIVKMSILPKLIYRFNRIPVKISARYFVDIDIDYSKIYMEK